MILWLTFGSIFAVWNVFQSPGLDFRLVALGALLPLTLDAPFGSQAYAHTLVSAVVVLTVTMATTAGRGHRLRRRRALSLPIGWFIALVLGGSWATKNLFWWPAFGWSFGHAPLPISTRPVLLLAVEEIVGVALLWWAWCRFRLTEPARRGRFFRTGYLGRDVL